MNDSGMDSAWPFDPPVDAVSVRPGVPSTTLLPSRTETCRNTLLAAPKTLGPSRHGDRDWTRQRTASTKGHVSVRLRPGKCRATCSNRSPHETANHRPSTLPSGAELDSHLRDRGPPERQRGPGPAPAEARFSTGARTPSRFGAALDWPIARHRSSRLPALAACPQHGSRFARRLDSPQVGHARAPKKPGSTLKAATWDQVLASGQTTCAARSSHPVSTKG